MQLLCIFDNLTDVVPEKDQYVLGLSLDICFPNLGLYEISKVAPPNAVTVLFLFESLYRCFFEPLIIRSCGSNFSPLQ